MGHSNVDYMLEEVCKGMTLLMQMGKVPIRSNGLSNLEHTCFAPQREEHQASLKPIILKAYNQGDHLNGIGSFPDLNAIKLLKISYDVSFSGSVWVKFDFFYFFIY